MLGEGLEQAKNLPIFRRSIRKFAFDNNFEVHDVIPDGNCMFRALADQLMINGFPGHTEASLRQDAITFVELNQVDFYQFTITFQPSNKLK